MLHIAIVEDEPAAARLLSDQLERYAGEKTVEMCSYCYEDGSVFCSEYNGQFDVIFLDVQMRLVWIFCSSPRRLTIRLLP